ncbi:signal transduction histidine kinase/ligand-binding sensor domain-containing protein [Duganella sp. SG902]|uniref:sensor histidine kinase n=1 Tax=Duganella sp. SG902 TaxID=2587016 RepID=UPI00159E5709|nr:two-component regulator propeller domain-containing protein [Duganella sp. SG902]NVM74307.1 signal transduction histidine kinase/ligand-binding sensor domain-containing protein [Duganella sp. SG902]
MTTARALLLLHAAAFCGLLWCAPSPAQQPASRLQEQYTHTAWSALDNAPVDILNIAQTSDGWLWLAAGTGLYRFDGRRYERMDSVEGHALLSSNVRTLYAPPEGGLWVGYRMGGGISYFHNGQARHYAAGQGLPGGAITSIARAPDGVLWVAARDGLARLDGDRFVTVGAEAGLPQRRARQVLFDRGGRQWVAMQGGIYSRADQRAPFRQAWPHGDLRGMALAPDGAVWASDVDSYYRMRPEAPAGESAARPALSGSNMYYDRDGNMWLFRAGGMERRGAGGDEAGQQQDLSGGLPQSFFQDREGNVWIGTSAGLNRFRRNRLLTLPLPTIFNHPAIAPVNGGGVWAGDRTGALHALGPEGERRSVLSGHISALYRDPDGVLWAGNDDEVWSADGGRVERYPLPPEARSYEVQAMSRAAGGGLWVSVVREGLYLLKDGQWRRQPAPPLATPAMEDQFPICLADGGDGALWAGYIRNHIIRIANGKATVFGAEQGVELGNVLTIYRDRDQLWAGGERGVAWFDGERFVPLHGRKGEAFRGVSGIALTARGDLWLFGTEGLTRIGAEQVTLARRQRGHEVEYERFDAHDGLLGAASQLRPMPSLVLGDDGLLWMATANRINWIDPSRIARNPVAPAVLVQGVAIGEQRYSPLPGLELPQSTNSLRIDYTALSLGVPERVRFRYRLDGVDNDWQDPGPRCQAFYTNLAPGHYRFRVMAANEDGVWNPQEAQLAFSIPPTFVETIWFKLLCAMALGVVLWMAYRLRLRHVTNQLRRRLEDRADERERIARALHDTFLQSVQGLMLRVQTLLKRLPPGGEAYQLVEKILNQADSVLAEGREQVSGLRTVETYQHDLPRLFSELGQQLREEHAADFALIVTGQLAPLRDAAGEHLYHIGREALLNAFRHAGACRIELELGYAQDHITLEVRDDGGGIPDDVLSAGELPGHWGLTGMRERAGKIDAALELWCRPGLGTVVQVRAPATAVYQRRRGALRRWLLREAA